MKADIKKWQSRVYSLLSSAGESCFLRVDQSDEALWVTDFPRRCKTPDEAERILAAAGIVCRLDSQTGLWHLDWTDELWQQVVSECPVSLPLLPRNEQLHEIYALCRLWLLHPELPQTLTPARKVLKILSDPNSSGQIAKLHQTAAQAVRRGEPGCFVGGRLLARWLYEKENEK